MLTIRLSLRLLRGAGGAGLLRVVLLLLGSALSAMVVLTLAGIPQTLAAQSARNAARLPVNSSQASAGLGTYVLLNDHFGGADVTRVLIATGARPTRPPPGVAALPSPGELTLSPALAQLVNSSPTWRHRFPGRQLALIGPAGLLGANELYAYIGVTHATLARTGKNVAPNGGNLAGFGTPTDLYPTLTDDQIRLLLRCLDGLIGVPLIVFALTCLRLSAATRQRRFAALRLLGLDARRTRNVSAVESGLVTLAAMPIGIGLFYPLNAVMARVGVAGSSWYSTDSSPSIGRLVVLIAVLPAIAAFLAAVGSRRSVRSPLVERRPVRVPTPSVWRMVPLACGLLVVSGLLYGESKGGGSASAAGLAVLGGLTGGLGAVLGLPWLTARTAQLGANHGRSLSLQLGLRRLQLEPSGSLRVVSVLVILVFIGCLGNGVARDVRSGQLTVSAIQLYSVKAAEVGPSARASLLGGNGSQGVAILQNNRTAVAFGSCAGLGALLGRTLTDCSNAGTRITYQGDRNAPLSPQQLVRLGANRGSPFNVTMPTRHLLLTEQDGTTLAPIQALLPLQDLPRGSIPSDASLTVGRPNTVEVNDAFYNSVYDAAPAADVTNEDQDYLAAESTDRFAGYFELALLLALTLGVSGFVIATADRAIERRPNIAALEVVGVPHRTIVVSQAVQLVVPLALGAVVALVPGLLTEQAYLIAGGQNPAWAWRSIATDVVFALIALLLAAAGATLAVGRRPDVSMLRRD